MIISAREGFVSRASVTFRETRGLRHRASIRRDETNRLADYSCVLAASAALRICGWRGSMVSERFQKSSARPKSFCRA